MSLGRFGQYELLRKVGAGGMGELFLARADGLAGFKKLIVIKRLLPHLSKGPDGQRFVDMFLDEARLAAQLNHPNIVQIYDLGNVEDAYYLAMEYVDGVDLRRYLRRGQQHEQALPVEHAVKIASFLCEALHYAHELRDGDGQPLNLVHRDVSPHNVLVSFDGAVKLTDFGIAKATTQVVKTQVGTLKGKLRYMAPEQAEEALVDRRADIFSIGILLYEMLAGVRPFDGVNEFDILEKLLYKPHAPLNNIVENIPFELTSIVDKALQKDPAGRFQNALEMQMELERFLLQQSLMSNATLIGQHLRKCFDEQIGARASSSAVEHSGPSGLAAQAEVAADFITSATPSYEILGEPSLSVHAQKNQPEPPTMSVTSPLAAEQILPATRAEKVPSADLREQAEQEFGDVFSSVSGIEEAAAVEADENELDDWDQNTARSDLEQAEPYRVDLSSKAAHEIDRTFKKSGKNKGFLVFFVALAVGILLVVAIGWMLKKPAQNQVISQAVGHKLQRTADAGLQQKTAHDQVAGAMIADASTSPDRQMLALKPDIAATQADLAKHNTNTTASTTVLHKGDSVPDEVKLTQNAALGGDKTKPKKVSHKAEVKVAETGTAETRVAKTKKPGFLTLQTIPWSEIWLGKKKLGMTPMFKRKLPAGRHTLTLKNTSKKIVRKLRIIIRSGKTTTRKVELSKLRRR